MLRALLGCNNCFQCSAMSAIFDAAACEPSERSAPPVRFYRAPSAHRSSVGAGGGEVGAGSREVQGSSRQL